MTVPRAFPTVPREQSTDRSPVPHPLGERERGTFTGTSDRSPPSTGIEAKAERLLVTGCVQIFEADADHAVAAVVGDHGTYLVWHDGRRVSCSCPATAACSHGVAFARVVPVAEAEARSLKAVLSHGIQSIRPWRPSHRFVPASSQAAPASPAIPSREKQCAPTWPHEGQEGAEMTRKEPR
jgi:hypothetical protein